MRKPVRNLSALQTGKQRRWASCQAARVAVHRQAAVHTWHPGAGVRRAGAVIVSLFFIFALCPASWAIDDDKPADKSVHLQGEVTKNSASADEDDGEKPTATKQSGQLEDNDKSTAARQTGQVEDDDRPPPPQFRIQRPKADDLKLKGNATDLKAGVSKTGDAALRAMNAQFAPRPAPPLTGRVDQLAGSVQMQALARYDLEIIIDRSLSMRRPDCPGGLSRWDWCGNQAVQLARSLAPYAPNGVTVTRFASVFDTYEHVGPATVASILQTHDFQLGTRLCEALASRIEPYIMRHRAGDKPLMIAVITDGRPWPRPEPVMVRQELVEATFHMTDPNEVKIVFLQIGGDDPRGEDYLLDLGNNLRGYGARYQFVRTVPFEELEQIGLAQALVNAAVPVKTSYR